MKPLKLLMILALCPFTLPAWSSEGIAYGSLTNFDTVNDTGHECHGFEIELEDCHSTDITRTYNYNHYGVPRIFEDDSVPEHTVCTVRWESRKNPDGSWAAYTAIPDGPIAPTDGHRFTNPNINFGGEHFGVGYRMMPTAVRYFWLIDDGAGNLVRGGQVQVAAPTFRYFPAAGGQPARVQAAIEPPEPPDVPVVEFGPPVWVKEIRTTTHNNNEIHLRDLVSDDPDDDDDLNWRNGEPDEIEVEWRLLQEEFGKADGGGMGELLAEPEDLNDGDEVVTRRYEFFEYIGPIDNESKEAKADKVGADDVHGDGIKTVNGVEVDLSTVEVVGDFKGSQMAAVDVEAALGLIDHIGDGVANEPYAGRSVVIQGAGAFSTSTDGALPAGMTFDGITGVLSGTPTETGQFDFSVTASDGNNLEIAKNYTFSIHPDGGDPLPTRLVDTAAFPAEGGSTTGDGAFAPGSEVIVTATPNPGFVFVNWTDDGNIVSLAPSYTFTLDVNHSLVANFAPAPIDDGVNFDPAASGSFSGLVLDETTGNAMGRIDIRLSSRKRFSGRLLHGALGIRLSLRGELDESGAFSGDFVRRGVTYAVALQLVASLGGKFRLEGSFQEEGNLHGLSLDRSGFHRRTNPATTISGAYTALLPADPAAAGPLGDGYAVAKVGAGGRIRFLGRLSDNTRLSRSGFVSEDGEWRLFVVLYRARYRGSIGGVITFRDVPDVSDFDGTLRWIKPADPRARRFPLGFAVDAALVGSIYQIPASGEAILPQFIIANESNATWQIGDGGVTDPGVKILSWPGNNRAVAQVNADERLRVRGASRNGLVTGSYSNRTTKERFSFKGVAFQKQGMVGGLFLGYDGSGWFLVEPVAAP